MEKGGCLYPCARRDQSLHAQHDDYLALRLSEGRVFRGNKARGRFSAEHVSGAYSERPEPAKARVAPTVDARGDAYQDEGKGRSRFAGPG
jgi:hypothetical protein